MLGQNVNSYGKETKGKLWNPDSLTWNVDGERRTEGKTPFRELLEAIGAIEGLDRLRFTSSNPHDMTRDILDAHFEIPTMTPYLHFALQSGSDSVLKRMNRKHTYADFKSQVDYLRSKNPLFSISTDIIVGFP
ncbi:MAG: tRNA-2-methylthio-N6-dimethylallyladenosine synthase [Patescibacteria group bacterium]|nr:tRNA-2-methylthio-N6-dimethylallyladenosine synthase [Patescibacteria group bacterium]